MPGYSVTFSVVDQASKNIDAINRRIAAMRAPMERLSKQVSRFVDVSGLNTIAKGFASIGRAAMSVLRTLVEIVPVLGTITGAATIAGMAKLVGTYANWSQQLTATADNLGMTTQQLQQFEDATRLAGGKTSDMDEALKALYKTQTDFVRGQASADQIGWLNRLGINVKDATGQLRSMADLMPEVEQKIAAIKNPADRAAASAALLGDANANLVETFRRSHQSFGAWMTDASRYTELSDKQKDQLEAYSQAQGRIGTAFDHLGQQLSATLAKNFTPLLNHLSEFVEKHTPEIIAAVDHISAEFAAWLEGVDWTKVEDGATALGNGLIEITKHLGLVKDAAEAVAAVFAIKWATNAVSAIAAVTSALGSVGGGGGVAAAAGGAGLLGALGAVAALGATIWGFKKGYDYLSQPDAAGEQRGGRRVQSPPASATAPEAMPYFNPRTPEGRAARSDWMAAHPQQAAPPTAPGAAGSLSKALGITPTEFDAFRGSISNIELRGRYDIMGGSSGRFAGKYQMGAEEIKETATRLGVKAPTQSEFLHDPAMQEKFFENYTLDHHNWLMAHNAKYAAMSPEDKAAALAYAHNQGAAGASKWIDTGMAGKDAFGTSGTAYSSAAKIALAQAKAAPAAPVQVAQAAPVTPPAANQNVAQAAPATPPPANENAAPPVQVAQATAPSAAVPPPAPVNGSVDVNITGKNIAPNTAITASASGQGVKAPPPRVEYQQMASI